jgi:hypothetical protein
MKGFAGIAAICLGFSSSSAFAVANATNAWISPGSGYWEEPNWSRGVMPANGDAVFLTNSGTKDLIIGQSTAQTFPESLSIWSVVIASPPNSTNRLLLDHAGLAVPLRVNELTMYSNSLLTVAGSAFSLEDYSFTGGHCSIGGTINMGDSSHFDAFALHLGDIGPAAFNLTNGNLNTYFVYLGESFPSTFLQQGGSHTNTQNMYLYNGQYILGGGQLSGSVLAYNTAKLVQNGGNFSGSVSLNDTSQLVLNGGAFSGTVALYSSIPLILGGGQFSGSVNVYSGGQLILNGNQLSGPVTVSGGTFTQSGGVYNGAISLGSSSYYLQDGFSTNSNLGLSSGSVPASVLQSGGTNRCGSLAIQGLNSGNTYVSATYTLSAGSLSANAVSVNFGSISQSGGSHAVTGSLTLQGGFGPHFSILLAYYSLGAGSLSANAITGEFAEIGQSGGTNLVAGTLSLGNSSFDSRYNLSGGRLETGDMLIAGNGSYINQTGGKFVVSNSLSVLTSAGYFLRAGQLSARDILLRGTTFYHSGGSVSQTGTLTLANGAWQCNTGRVDLGQLRLGATGGSNGSITLPDGGCVMAFSNSSSITWSNQQTLTIENWDGSIYGGGALQIRFGNNATGLTAQQLSQIRFDNPAGFSGTYPARILASGEITPGPVLETARSGNALVLTWSAGAVLQTATNVNGPYGDLTGISPPYTNQTTEPRRFFRLRQ